MLDDVSKSNRQSLHFSHALLFLDSLSSPPATLIPSSNKSCFFCLLLITYFFCNNNNRENPTKRAKDRTHEQSNDRPTIDLSLTLSPARSHSIVLFFTRFNCCYFCFSSFTNATFITNSNNNNTTTTNTITIKINKESRDDDEGSFTKQKKRKDRFQ